VEWVPLTVPCSENTPISIFVNGATNDCGGYVACNANLGLRSIVRPAFVIGLEITSSLTKVWSEMMILNITMVKVNLLHILLPNCFSENWSVRLRPLIECKICLVSWIFIIWREWMQSCVTKFYPRDHTQNDVVTCILNFWKKDLVSLWARLLIKK